MKPQNFKPCMTTLKERLCSGRCWFQQTMSFANPSVLLDGDREIVVVIGTTTCNRPRTQLPPDVDVGDYDSDDDSDSRPSKGSFSATLSIVERKTSTSRMSLHAQSAA